MRSTFPPRRSRACRRRIRRSPSPAAAGFRAIGTIDTAGGPPGGRGLPGDHAYSEGTAAVSTIQGDRATFTFTGTSVSWIGYRGPQAGIARVILDGSVVTDSLDLYIPSEGPQEAVFTLPGLAAGSHTLTIEVTGSKNPASLGVSIVVDAFDVTP